jgi:hypothetical protein
MSSLQTSPSSSRPEIKAGRRLASWAPRFRRNVRKRSNTASCCCKHPFTVSYPPETLPTRAREHLFSTAILAPDATRAMNKGVGVEELSRRRHRFRRLPIGLLSLPVASCRYPASLTAWRSGTHLKILLRSLIPINRDDRRAQRAWGAGGVPFGPFRPRERFHLRGSRSRGVASRVPGPRRELPGQRER